MNKLKLALVGINHKSSTLEEREIFQLTRGEMIEFLETMNTYREVDSLIILNTCNRLEYYMVINQETEPSKLVKRAYETKGIDFEKYNHIFYTYDNGHITRHLFKVISGLDSLVIGEFQIQGQVKEAYSIACEVKTVNKTIHKLFHAAFRVGKKVRNKTSIAEGRKSVSGAAAQIILDNLNKDELITIIGVNENTKIISEKLKYNGYKNFIFINRTKSKAENMAEQFGGKAYDWDNLNEALTESNAAFTSTGAKDYIISSDEVNQINQSNSKFNLIIDMAVPRDFQSKGLCKDIKYFDIDDLKHYLEEQNKLRLEAIPQAEQMIEEAVSIFQEWSENQENFILEPYLEKFEMERQEVLEEFRKYFTAQSFEKADKLTKSLVHRLQATFTRAIIKTNQELKVLKQHRDSM